MEVTKVMSLITTIIPHLRWLIKKDTHIEIFVKFWIVAFEKLMIFLLKCGVMLHYFFNLFAKLGSE